jgi:hypothetical protein
MSQALQYADFTIFGPTISNIVKWGDRMDSDEANPARQKGGENHRWSSDISHLRLTFAY